MTKITIKRVRILTFIKWHLLSSLFTGILVGLIYSGIGYYRSGGNGLEYLFWYGLGIPFFYLVVGLLSAVIIGTLYNALSTTFGGMSFDVEMESEGDGSPPPPPNQW